MSKFRIWAPLLLLILLPAVCGADIAIHSAITIKPGNADDAAQRLVTEAKRLRGYFVIRSSESVTLKLPAKATNEMQQFIENNWRIYQQDYQAQDVSTELLDARARLRAKEDLLDEYRQVLKAAPADKIVNVTAAVTKLVEDIELLRGRIRLLEHQTRYATVTVNFHIDRDRMDRNAVTSSFTWLNTLGLDNLLREFR